MEENELHKALKYLSNRRPVFHSEADFQHELALELERFSYQVRLEVPKQIQLNGSNVKAEIDLLIQKDSV